MFSQASVILSIGGVGWQGGHACWGGAYMLGGMHGRGHCCRGMCMAGGACMAGGWDVWQGGRGACMAGETATAVDGMSPTGMYSCLNFNLGLKLRNPLWSQLTKVKLVVE